MLWERAFRALAGDAPLWLLYSGIAIATRELTSREVQKGLISTLGETGDSREKARALSLKLRSNLDDRVQRLLQPAGYGNAERLVNRFVEGELGDLRNNIRSPYDVIDNDITKDILELAEAEVAGRLQDAGALVLGVNQTTAERDLQQIFRRADADGNEIITFDELYEMMIGRPIYPLAAPMAREIVVLKSKQTADSPWEASASLLIAPQLKRLSQVLSISRRAWERTTTAIENIGDSTSKLSREVTERFWEPIELELEVQEGMQEGLLEGLPKASSKKLLPPAAEAAAEAKLLPPAALFDDGPDESAALRRSAHQTDSPPSGRRWRKPWTWLRPRRQDD